MTDRFYFLITKARITENDGSNSNVIINNLKITEFIHVHCTIFKGKGMAR